MKSLTNLRKGLALVLCAAMLMGDTTMLQASQVESTTVAALMTKGEAEVEDVQAETEEVLTDAEEVIPAEEEVKEADSVTEVAEAEETEVAKEQTETTEAPENQQESEKPQVEAPDVETALENKALEATYTATVGATTVTVVAPEGAFTEEVTLQVTEVEITNEIQAQLDEQAIAEQKAINSASAYDISFVNAEGKEVEPAKEVQVSIATSAVNSGDDASVYHFDEEKAALNDMEAVVDHAGDLAFETDHFSVYVIVNKSDAEVDVTLHHVVKNNNKVTSLFTDDVIKMAPYGVITNYNKGDASSWEIAGVYTDAGLTQSAVVNANNQIEVNNDTEYWIQYRAIENKDYAADVTFWDYKVKPKGEDVTEYYTYKYTVFIWERIWPRWNNYQEYRDEIGEYYYYSKDDKNDSYLYFSGSNGSQYLAYVYKKERINRKTQQEVQNVINNDKDKFPSSYLEKDYYNKIILSDSINEGYKDSINYSERYKDCQKNGHPEDYVEGRASLTVGKNDENSKQNYELNRHSGVMVTDGPDINQYAGNNVAGSDNLDKVRKGIVQKLDGENYSHVVFNVNNPGVFTKTPSAGKDIYDNGQYSLIFTKTGDTYELTAVRDNNSKQKVADAGNLFFPLDSIPGAIVADEGNLVDRNKDTVANSKKDHNDYFGMRYDVTFQLGDYAGPLTYNFTGDDDLWVFLDGKLISALDLGGIHQAISSGDVNLWDELPKLPNGDYDREATHTLTVLYMERGGGDSDCNMKFTIPRAGFVNYSTPLGNLDFTKVDENGAALEGAKFELVGQNGLKTTAVSGKDGKVNFNNLYVGTYTLTEKEAPEGYQKSDKEWTVKVVANADNTTATATLYDGDKAITEIENTLDKKEEFSKKAKMIQVDGKDTRTYQIDLNANFTTTTTTPVPTPVPTSGNANVVLVLDMSSSMLNEDTKYELKANGNTLRDALAEITQYNKNGKPSIKQDGTYYVKLDNKYYQVTNVTNKNGKGIYYSVKYVADGTKKYYYYASKDEWHRGSNLNDKVNLTDDNSVYSHGGSAQRLAVLKNATKELVHKLPDGTKVAIVTFNSSAYVKLGVTELDESSRRDINTLLDSFGRLDTATGTHASYGFDKAYGLLNAEDKNNYVIYFTDGEDNAMSDAQAKARKLKEEKKATLYAVGILENPSEKVQKHMDACDSREKATLGADITTLPNIFSELAETINEETQQTTTGDTGVVVDTVDSRFDLLDKDGNKITKSGTYEIGGKSATVTVGTTTTITWNAQELKDWSASFQIQAKDDFLGGNLVPTNDPSNSYVVDKEHSFEVPYVNVPLGNITLGNDEETDFLGDVVDTAANGASALLATVSVDKPTADELKAGGTVTKRYSYNGAEFGTLTFSYDTSDGIVGEHELTKKGDAVETYKMKITYTADTPEQRGIEDKDKESYDGAVVTSTTTGADKGIYKVNVVAGKLTINKTISNADYKAAFGDPVFTFKITNDKGKIYFRTLRFSEIKAPAEGENPKDVTLTATITDLPSGNYTVKELPTLGFKLTDLTANGTNAGTVKKNKSAREATFSFGYVENQTEYAVTVNYKNEKKHSPRDTDTDVVKNHFHVEKGSVVITPVDDVDNGTTTDTSGRDATNNN